MALTMGGQDIRAKPLPTLPDPETPDRVILFMRLVAMNLETRRDLATAVRRVRTLERKLNDPALADHAGRGKAERRLSRRQNDEHTATVRLIELNVSLSRQWEHLTATEKRRYALTDLVGETDPDAPILIRLWCDTCGLTKLVPFPPNWTVPNDLSHRVFDDSVEIREISMAEVLNSPIAPF